jgi:hypothetical protein
MPKVVGVSKGVVINIGGRRARKPTRQKTTANRTQKQIEKEKQAHAYEISGLYFSARPSFECALINFFQSLASLSGNIFCMKIC